ncbi:WD repeat-containing protein 3-like [Eurosta solidaginis]|uniref:WD repeat-containing protein 3-like n=1 Tax=Eurosta solidaginis TaxID=178769 RepID=UPI003530D718
MGLTKKYLAYRPIDSFNIINSGRSNGNVVIYNKTEGRYALVAAVENVIIWNLGLGERALTLRRDKQENTALRASPDRTHIDGVFELFDLCAPEQSVCTLALHKCGVRLRFDDMGIRLLSGSLNTELIVVDNVEQAGRQRLIGHNAPITDEHFLQHFAAEQNIIVSCS